MRYLSSKDLREKLGNRSRSSIYRDVERGDLPAPFKLGQHLFWREDEVDEALAVLRTRPHPVRMISQIN